MVAHIERRRSSAAIWSRRLAVFALALLLIAAVGHRFGRIETIGYFWILGIVVTLCLSALFLAGMGFLRLWEHGERAGRASLTGVAIALVALAPFGYALVLMLTHPRLSDISTDAVDPPRLEQASAVRTAQMNPIAPIPPEAAELQTERYPEVTGRRYSFTVDRTVGAINAAVRDIGWTLTHNPQWRQGELDVTIEIENRSYIFGFPADMAVRVVDEGETSYVDMRSVSRYGRHDLGSNAARIVQLLRALDRRMSVASGL